VVERSDLGTEEEDDAKRRKIIEVGQ